MRLNFFALFSAFSAGVLSDLCGKKLFTADIAEGFRVAVQFEKARIRARLQAYQSPK